MLSYESKTETAARAFKVFWLLIFLALVLLRVYLSARANLYVLGDSEYDDYLGVRQAASLLKGEWLGSYGKMTLIKGISFPMLLAFFKLLHIPYAAGLGLVMAACCLPIIPALRIRFGTAVSAALCLIMLYSPIGFNGRVTFRIYRNAVSPFIALLILTSLIAVWLRRACSIKRWLPWILTASLSLAFFWHLREDAIWIVPLFLGFAVLMLLYLLVWRKPGLRTLLPALLILLLPIFGLVLSGRLIALKNSRAYGVAVVNDRTASSFADCMGLLLRIDDGLPKDRRVWISRHMLETAESVSPSLASMHDELRVAFDRWTQAELGEVWGDYPQWAMRDAAEMAGHYTDAAETEAFFASVAKELREAYADGRLKKDSAFYISSQSRGLTPEDVPGVIRGSLHNLKNLLSFRYAGADWPTLASGSSEHLALFHEITDCTLLHSDEEAAQHGAMRIAAGAANGLVALYRLLWIPALILSLLSAALLLVTGIRASLARRGGHGDKNPPGFPLLICLGIFASAGAGIAAVTLFSEYRMNDYVDCFYLGGQMPLLLACELGLILLGAERLRILHGNTTPPDVDAPAKP